MTTEIDEAVDVWSGDDLTEFLDDYNLTPEQVALALMRQPLTIRNWMRSGGDPFAGNPRDSHVLRLAIIGIVAEAKGGPLGPVGGGPPLHLDVYIDLSTGRAEVGLRKMIRQRRTRGTGAKPGVEFTEVWPS